MKVSFGGKVRKVSNWPESMDDLRKVVSRKFTERSLLDDFDESQQLSISKPKKHQKRKQLIDWAQTTFFYEDSEGDFNVISEEEDLADAHTYSLMKAPQMLKCSVLDRDLFQ